MSSPENGGLFPASLTQATCPSLWRGDGPIQQGEAAGVHAAPHSKPSPACLTSPPSPSPAGPSVRLASLVWFPASSPFILIISTFQGPAKIFSVEPFLNRPPLGDHFFLFCAEPACVSRVAFQLSSPASGAGRHPSLPARPLLPAALPCAYKVSREVL